MKAEGKNKSVLRWVSVGGVRHKERGNEDEYGGCILYPYVMLKE
jgi:hypothetical protein